MFNYNSPFGNSRNYRRNYNLNNSETENYEENEENEENSNEFGWGLNNNSYTENNSIKEDSFLLKTPIGSSYKATSLFINCNDNSKYLNAFLYCTNNNYKQDLSGSQRLREVINFRQNLGNDYLNVFLIYINELISNKEDITIPGYIINLFKKELLTNVYKKPDILHIRVNNENYGILRKQIDLLGPDMKKLIETTLTNYHYIVDYKNYSDSELFLYLLEYNNKIQIIYYTGNKNNICDYSDVGYNNVIIIRKKKQGDVESIEPVMYNNKIIFSKNENIIEDLLNSCANISSDKIVNEQDLNTSMNVIITFILIVIISLVALLNGF
jgi:hypothetical protein